MCVLCLCFSFDLVLLSSQCVCVGANCLCCIIFSICTRTVRFDCLVPTPGYLNCLYRLFLHVSPTLTPEESRAKPWSTHRAFLVVVSNDQ